MFFLGITSSGYTQANLELKSGVTYYSTVKAITNVGSVLESVSDGFTVDTSPPDIILDRYVLMWNWNKFYSVTFVVQTNWKLWINFFWTKASGISIDIRSCPPVLGQSNWWCNGLRDHHDCSRSSVWASVGSKQKNKFGTSPLLM